MDQDWYLLIASIITSAGASKESRDHHTPLSQEDHTLLYVHCHIKPNSWPAAVRHIEAIDIGTDVRRTPSIEGMNEALNRYKFGPMIVDELGRIERDAIQTLAEDLKFKQLSLRDETSNLQRQRIDDVLGIGRSG